MRRLVTSLPWDATWCEASMMQTAEVVGQAQAVAARGMGGEKAATWQWWYGHTHMHTQARTHTQRHAHTGTHARIHMHARMHMYMHAHTQASTGMHAHTQACTYVHTHSPPTPPHPTHHTPGCPCLSNPWRKALAWSSSACTSASVIRPVGT